MAAVRTWITGLAFYGLLATTLFCYWPGLTGPLLLDDASNLGPLRQLESGLTTWRDVITGNGSGILGRPVAMLSFALNTAASGFDVWTFKYTNLMIHLLSGTLVFWLAGILFRHTGSRRPWELALLTAALWLLSPLLTSTVLYTVQRMAQLSTLFTLMGVLAYVLGRRLSATAPRRGLLLIGSGFFLFTPLATLSKENGALLPALLLLTEVYFFRFQGSVPLHRTLKLSFILAVGIPYTLAAAWLLWGDGGPLEAYRDRDFSLPERVLTQTRILASYVAALLFPSGGSLGLFHDDYPLSTGLLAPWTTLAAILAWMGVAAGAVALRRTGFRAIAYGLAFFLLAHALESGVIPLELYFEHRNYLPAFGLYFALVAGLALLLERLSRPRRVLALGFLIPLFFGFATLQRAYAWQTWDTILLTNAPHHPRSSRLATELATLRINRGDIAGALDHLERSVVLKPINASGARLHALVGHCLTRTDPEQTLTDQPGPYRATGYATTALNLLTDLLARNECRTVTTSSVIGLVESWLAGFPPHEYRHRWALHFNLGRLLYADDQREPAIAQMERALSLDPGRLEAGLLFVRYRIESGKIPAARAALRRVSALDRGRREDHTRTLAAFESLIESLEEPEHAFRYEY